MQDENALNAKSIDEIEQTIEVKAKSYQESRKEFIELLYYLERTRRFRENKLYKNRSFDDYIRERFCLTPTTYQWERKAFTLFLLESEAIGPGLVQKAMRITGSASRAVPMVREMVQATKPAEVPKIIDKYKAKYPARTPVPAHTPDTTAIIEGKNEALKESIKEIESKDEQIEKLKAAVVRYKQTIKLQEAEITRLKQELVRLRSKSARPAYFDMVRPA